MYLLYSMTVTGTESSLQVIIVLRYDAAAEIRRNPVSKHQIQLEYGDEQADAEQDC